MSAHTPGPLKQAARYSCRSPRVEQIDLVDSEGQRVASVLADDTEAVENCTILEVVSRHAKANASELVRRWNAHDDLLAALEMVRDADEDRILDGDDPLYGLPKHARAKIDAAIAKAKP